MPAEIRYLPTASTKLNIYTLFELLVVPVDPYMVFLLAISIVGLRGLPSSFRTSIVGCQGVLPHLKEMSLISSKASAHLEAETQLDTSFAQRFDSSDSDAAGDYAQCEGVITFFDTHYSHVNLEVIVEAKKNNITMVFSPPNTTLPCSLWMLFR